VSPVSSEFTAFLSRHPVLKKSSVAAQVIARLALHGSVLQASAISDYIRQQLLDAGISFTFETVMSDRSKIELLALAKAKGYRVYVYYIATDDPEINVSRVEARFRGGGHGVAPVKIRERYKRSLDLLADAIALSDRAFVFDNSGIPGSHVWLAEITDSHELEIISTELPDWFRSAVMDKFGVDASDLK
jgi:predicted ABC-type ATPase